MKRATADPRVRAVVLHGDGRTFPAGADITEFKGMRESRGTIFTIYIQKEIPVKHRDAYIHPGVLLWSRAIQHTL